MARKTRRNLTALAGLAATLHACAGWHGSVFVPDTLYVYDSMAVEVDSLGRSYIIVDQDTLHTSFLPSPDELYHAGPLTDADYQQVADRLGVEKAAIKAIVEIETGRIHRGINPDGSTVINFDLPVFRRAAARRGISLARHASSVALQPVNAARYGSQQAAQHARLSAAAAIDTTAAYESTFWGMFQIGGFNWRLCGASSLEDFARRMSRSEYDQLQLFANYMQNTGLVKYLKNKNWAAFARIYNGPSYAARRYHTRIAEAYRRHSATPKPPTTAAGGK